MAAHDAVIEWKMGEGDFVAGRYSRAHTLSFDGGAVVAASASPSVVRAPWSDPTGVDPEEMLVAALSSCHMLWFLDVAHHAGFAVSHYRDEARGIMGKDTEGRTYMARTVLRPAVQFAGSAPAPQALKALHHKAHMECFIANSVRGEVVVEPVEDMASAMTKRPGLTSRSASQGIL